MIRSSKKDILSPIQKSAAKDSIKKSEPKEDFIVKRLSGGNGVKKQVKPLL